jgi:hypothetical protein
MSEGMTMDSGKLGSWLQIIANVGIVVGLIFGGIQLKQNSDLLKTQLLYEESYRAIDLETKFVGEEAAAVWAKSITDAKTLNLEEQRIMEAILWGFVEQLRATRMLAEMGLLENEEWKVRVSSDAAYYLSNEYGIAWWSNFSALNSSLPEDLKAEINARLSEVGEDFTVDYAKSIIDRISEKGRSAK